MWFFWRWHESSEGFFPREVIQHGEGLNCGLEIGALSPSLNMSIVNTHNKSGNTCFYMCVAESSFGRRIAGSNAVILFVRVVVVPHNNNQPKIPGRGKWERHSVKKSYPRCMQ
jgi:hypothetical protein